MRETIDQLVAQDTAPDPAGGQDARRSTQHGAPDRRSAIADAARRHGRTRSATTFHGCKEPVALDVDSTVTREVVVGPAHQPEPEAVERLAEEWEQGPGLFQLDIDLGSRASLRMAPWAAPRRAHPGSPLAARRAAVDQTRRHAGLPARHRHLSQRPARADGPRPGGPVSGQGL
jgi:hypothetical protein